MPCAILLNDGHTLAAVLESCLADGSYWITMAYAEDDWVHLSGTEEGPADRQSNLFVGAGGYLVQFPSGETAVSYNDSESLLSIRMGDEQARNLREPYRPFKGYGYWGTMEVTGGHTVMASMHASMASSQNMIMVGECVLNHGVEAPLQSIRVDGDNSDWDGVDQALFIGSNSPVQGLFRFSHDRDHVYVCVDLLDESVSASDYVVLELDRLSSSERPSENALRVRLNSRTHGLSVDFRTEHGPNPQICRWKVPVDRAMSRQPHPKIGDVSGSCPFRKQFWLVGWRPASVPRDLVGCAIRDGYILKYFRRCRGYMASCDLKIGIVTDYMCT